MFHGYGTLVESDGSVYKGEFYNDCMQGFGRYTYPDGDYYEGQWWQDMQHGQGTEVEAGEKYVGGWF